MKLRKMSNNNEYFLFEDTNLSELSVYTLKNFAVKDHFISDAQRRKFKNKT